MYVPSDLARGQTRGKSGPTRAQWTLEPGLDSPPKEDLGNYCSSGLRCLATVPLQLALVSVGPEGTSQNVIPSRLRLGAAWARGKAATPAEAPGAVSVLCLSRPPLERHPEDSALPDTVKPGMT